MGEFSEGQNGPKVNDRQLKFVYLESLILLLQTLIPDRAIENRKTLVHMYFINDY